MVGTVIEFGMAEGDPFETSRHISITIGTLTYIMPGYRSPKEVKRAFPPQLLPTHQFHRKSFFMRPPAQPKFKFEMNMPDCGHRDYDVAVMAVSTERRAVEGDNKH